MVKNERELVFELIIKHSKFEKNAFTINMLDSDFSPRKQGGLTLNSCFNAFSTEELLNGDD